VKLTWAGAPKPIETRVTRADAPKVLEYSDTRWELEAFAGGTRLTLWHNVDPRFIAWGTAGWHIAFDVLDRLLAGQPIGRIVDADAMKFAGRQRLNAEYARLFLIKTPSWPPPAAQEPLMMNQATVFRWIHIVFAIPIIGYVYSPFDQIPDYARPTRFVFVPLLALSGLWMWKGHVVRRLVSKRSESGTGSYSNP